MKLGFLCTLGYLINVAWLITLKLERRTWRLKELFRVAHAHSIWIVRKVSKVHFSNFPFFGKFYVKGTLADSCYELVPSILWSWHVRNSKTQISCCLWWWITKKSPKMYENFCSKTIFNYQSSHKIWEIFSPICPWSRFNFRLNEMIFWFIKFCNVE